MSKRACVWSSGAVVRFAAQLYMCNCAVHVHLFLLYNMHMRNGTNDSAERSRNYPTHGRRRAPLRDSHATSCVVCMRRNFVRRTGRHGLKSHIKSPVKQHHALPPNQRRSNPHPSPPATKQTNFRVNEFACATCATC